MRRARISGFLAALGYAALILYATLSSPHAGPAAAGPAESAQDEIAALPAHPPLTLITEPENGIAPIEAAIASASSSIDMVMYELEDLAIEQALVEAKGRGVVVRVALPDLDTFGTHPNDAAYDFLTAAGVSVRWTPSYFPLTHQKTLTINAARAYILTFNLTPQYYASSRDFGIIDADAADVGAIESAFDSDWNGVQKTAAPGHDLLWSPGSADALLYLIGTASSTLDVYNEEMADPRITLALEDAAARGVAVRVVMTYETEWKPALNELTESGVRVRTYASSAKFYIHAKAIIADGARGFVGSENFSAQSMNANRELGILLSGPDTIASLETTFQNDWNGARPYAVKQ